MSKRITLTLFLQFFVCCIVFAKVDLRQYDSSLVIDNTYIENLTHHRLDSIFDQSVFLTKIEAKYGVEKIRPNVNRTPDFYILMGLVLFLGFIRFIDPKYLFEIWQAYFNIGLNSRLVKEKLNNAVIPNALMNVFFTLSFATYVFYVVRNFVSSEQLKTGTPFLVLILVGGVIAIYITKYLVIRFTGWVFNMKTVADNYLYNVFLVNKVLAIALLPFIVILAFPNPTCSYFVFIISIIIAIASFVSRYIRSWQVLGSFFQYSKFHFFTYLCASEILPLAVLMKFVLTELA